MRDVSETKNCITPKTTKIYLRNPNQRGAQTLQYVCQRARTQVSLEQQMFASIGSTKLQEMLR